MAALILGLAGSAIGGSAAVTGALGITAATGASIGWSIGSMLGSMIGPKQRIEGPRLQDGKVQAATHGQAIPIIYGTFRTAGNILDFSGMREHAKTETSKKAKSSVTTYSYDCDVAVAICKGEIVGVRRIWANNELIYSVAEDADLNTLAANNRAAGDIKIYTGSEEQLPDPTLEALHGAGNVPAYRGLAYIVISRIWVEKYGNRLPNFEFEVVGKGVGGLVAIRVPEADSPSIALSSIGSTVFQSGNGIQASASIALDGTSLTFSRGQVAPYGRVFEQPFLVEIPQHSDSVEDRRLVFAPPVSPVEAYEVWPDGWPEPDWQEEAGDQKRLFGFHGKDGLSVAVIQYYSLIEMMDTPPYFVPPSVYSGNCTIAVLYDYAKDDAVVHGSSIPFTTWRAEDVGSIHTSARFISIVWLDQNSIGCVVCIPLGAPGAAPATHDLYKLLSAPIHIDPTSRKRSIGEWRQIADQQTPRYLGPPPFWGGVLSTRGNIERRNGGYETANQNTELAQHGSKLYRLSTQSGQTRLSWLSLADGSSGFSADITGLPTGLKNTSDQLAASEVRFAETLRISESGVCTAYLVSSAPGAMGARVFRFKKVVFNIAGGVATVDADWQGLINYSDTFINWVAREVEGILFFDIFGRVDAQPFTWTTYAVSARLSRGSALLRDVLVDVCGTVGVAPDVEGVPLDAEVGGYAIGRPMPARGAIEPLQNAHFFDAVESDYGLKFVMRGGEPVATIVDADMQAGFDAPEDGDPSAVVRGQEVELPQSVSIGYADWDSDYQTSAELVQRIATPSVNKFQVELPIAMRATEAARIADVWMYQAWSERTQLVFKVGAKHTLLEPTDVVTVQTAGRSFKARITSKTDDRGVIDIGAVVDGGRYTSNATGSSNFGSQTGIATKSPTMLFLLNSPIVSDADDDAGFYAALLPDAVLTPKIEWSGATLLANSGGATDVTQTIGSVSTPAATVCLVQIDAPQSLQAANVVDQSVSMLVRTNGQELHSITRAQLFSGGNLFARVSGKTGAVLELLQFQFAQEVAEFEYMLTGILRGRFGTESGAQEPIRDGVYLVQLNPRNGVLRVPSTPDRIGRSHLFKAVTNGEPIEDARPIAFASSGRGLHPYAPVRLNAARVGNDWHLRWTRRSRLDGGWRESVDVPLGEAVEQYEVTILGGRVATATAQSFVYTEAMQLADFSSLQSDIEFSVAQISAVVGRGEAAFWSN